MLGCSLCLWPTLTAGATVSLNETDIVVQEGDSNTTINICVVLQDDMGGLERDVVVTIILMPDTINSKPTTSFQSSETHACLLHQMLDAVTIVCCHRTCKRNPACNMYISKQITVKTFLWGTANDINTMIYTAKTDANTPQTNAPGSYGYQK